MTLVDPSRIKNVPGQDRFEDCALHTYGEPGPGLTRICLQASAARQVERTPASSADPDEREAST